MSAAAKRRAQLGGAIGDVAWGISGPQGKISFIRRNDSDARQHDEPPVS